MDQDASGVVRGCGALRKGRVAKDDSIIGGITVVVLREGGITEETPGIIIVETHGVDVESVDGSLPKVLLHGSLLGVFGSGVVEPVRVHSPGNAYKLETEPGSSEFLVQDSHLVLDIGISEISGLG